jgi:hypothetical protein
MRRLAINVFFTAITVTAREFFYALVSNLGQVGLELTPIWQKEVGGYL